MILEHKIFSQAQIGIFTEQLNGKEQFAIPVSKPTNFKLENFTLKFTSEKIETETLNGFRFRIQIGAAKKPIQLNKISFDFTFDFEPSDQLFCNGFQSWTETKEFQPTDTINTIRKISAPLFKQFGDYSFYESSQKAGRLHGWTYAYIRPQQEDLFKQLNLSEAKIQIASNDISFLGSVFEKNGYSNFEFDVPNDSIKITKDCKGTYLKDDFETILDLILLNGQDSECFDFFANQFPVEQSSQLSKIEELPKPVAGWTSWYHYYDKINEHIILKNLKAFHSQHIPIELFQIDDGWQRAVGDWILHKPKSFPRGMRFLSDQIHNSGYRAGLWLAPFICERKSYIYQNHKDWLLKDKEGKVVKAAFNAVWQSWMYVLDFYNPEVRSYLKKTFDQILNTWNFDMVKLDFLFAVAMHPKTGKSRGQIMTEAMLWLREVVGDKTILACGVPLGPAFGLVDFCRIGADIHLAWEMNLLKWLGSRERVSTILSLKNTVHRRHLNNRFFRNDPDVSILREEKNWLTETQRKTVFFINQLFGDLQFVSDYIPDYKPNMRHLYLAQFPQKQKEITSVKHWDEVYEMHFKVGGSNYLAFTNFGERGQIISLIKQIENYGDSILVFNSSTKRHCSLQDSFELDAYESICFLLVETTKKKDFVIAGSTGHIFPMTELNYNWTEPNKLQITKSKDNLNESEVWILANSKLPLYINNKIVSKIESERFYKLTIK